MLSTILKIFFNTLYNLKIDGIDNMPSEGPFIIASNHASFYDPPVIIAAVQRKIHWIINKNLYNVIILNKIFKLFGHIGANGASGKVIELLNKGCIIGIFPEGTRTYNGNLLKGKTGAALLALKTQSTIVPCAVKGTFDVYPRSRTFPRLGNIKVIFGKPIFLNKQHNNHITDECLESATKIIMNNIKKLLDNDNFSA